MPIPIRLEDDQAIRSVLDEWARDIEGALRDHFGPAISVSRAGHDDDEEQVLSVSQGGTPRSEIVLRWDPAAPHEISVFPQPARAAMEGRAKGDTLAFRVAAGCFIAATALWLGAAIGFWSDFVAIRDLRGKVVVLVVAFSAWVITSFGLAAAAYFLIRRSHRALDAPRVERHREWLDLELRPWLEVELDYLQQRAREDGELARRLAL